MSTEAARHTPKMPLRELVSRYCELGGGYGRAVALEVFGLTNEETEHIFGVFDEDYNISRFFHFLDAEGRRYPINGFPATHVIVDADIETVL
jgi:hypothetical protein